MLCASFAFFSFLFPRHFEKVDVDVDRCHFFIGNDSICFASRGLHPILRRETTHVVHNKQLIKFFSFLYATMSSSPEISPPIPSGYPRMKVAIAGGLAYLTAIYLLTDFIYPYLSNIVPPLAGEYCPDGVTSGCERASLFAFEIASGQALLFCGITGFVAWHMSRAPFTKIPQTPEGRLFGYIKEADYLTSAAVTFQLWDLIVSILIPEQCTAIMIGHHFMAALVAWYGLNNQYFHYYAIFFLGCSEVSGIFLVLVDIAKFHKPLPNTTFDFIVSIAGPLFAVSFFYYRVYLWWQVSYLMWTDIYHVLNNGSASKLRPGRNHVLYFMLIGNVILGLLQLYWFTIILEEAKKLFFGEQES